METSVIVADRKRFKQDRRGRRERRAGSSATARPMARADGAVPYDAITDVRLILTDDHP
jgi:hypothetical protein